MTTSHSDQRQCLPVINTSIVTIGSVPVILLSTFAITSTTSKALIPTTCRSPIVRAN